MADYGEPWIEGDSGIVDRDNCKVAGFKGDDAWDTYGIEPHHMERIVAAINFCRGIPTEELAGRYLLKDYWPEPK